MSLCDRCFAPGACCKGMTFNEGNESDDPAVALAHITERFNQVGDPMPFEPWQRVYNPEWGKFWRWKCRELTTEGRCGIYETRPRACQVFEPASDQLCVHWKGAESGDASVGL